jgi:hypothetical protein
VSKNEKSLQIAVPWEKSKFILPTMYAARLKIIVNGN